MKKNNLKFFPPEEELEKICQELSDPNYPRTNRGLPENPTTLEISKYNLCQKILAYKQVNKLSTEKLAKQIDLTIPEIEDILFARIDKFTLDRLVAYTANLFPFHLAIHEDQPKSIKRSRKTRASV